MLTSALSGGGEVPGASSLFSARNRQKSSHPSPVTLCSAGSGPKLNPPPSVARENASQPKPLPGAGHRAAGLATAPQEAPDPRGATISWTRVPMSYLPLLGNLHRHLAAARRWKEKKWLVGGSGYKGARNDDKKPRRRHLWVLMGNVFFTFGRRSGKGKSKEGTYKRKRQQQINQNFGIAAELRVQFSLL